MCIFLNNTFRPTGHIFYHVHFAGVVVPPHTITTAVIKPHASIDETGSYRDSQPTRHWPCRCRCHLSRNACLGAPKWTWITLCIAKRKDLNATPMESCPLWLKSLWQVDEPGPDSKSSNAHTKLRKLSKMLASSKCTISVLSWKVLFLRPKSTKHIDISHKNHFNEVQLFN